MVKDNTAKLVSGDDGADAARALLKMAGEGKKNTFLKRGFRMGKLGLGLAGSYLGYQLQNVFVGEDKRAEHRKLFNALAALQVREELQSLKGPLMKLGQTLSMQSQVFPEEVVKELTNLQLRAPAMHSSLARAQFKGAYGMFPEEVFEEFAAEPFAAASLGQVHKAVTKSGEQVAVKIQYPAIRSAIENDFKLLRSISIPARLSQLASDAVISELQEGILKETDYIQEGKNIEFFREQLKPLPYVKIPTVLWHLTAQRVLTMSFVPGQPLSDIISKANPSQQMRNEIGSRLLALFVYQLRHVHALHADPHPGNYLIDASGSIGLVDFGCVKKFSPEFIKLVRIFREPDWYTSREKSQLVARMAWGPKVANRPRIAHRLLNETKQLHDSIFGTHGAVDFGDPEVLRKFVHLWTESIRSKGVNPEFAFYGRAELGLYNVLHQLRAKIHTALVLANLTNPTASSMS